MRVVNRLFGVAVATVLVAGAAEAQSCLGYPSFSKAGKNVSAQAYLPDGATTLAGQVNFGKGDTGTFFGVNAGFTTFDGIDDKQISVGGLVGTQMANGKLAYCPIGTLSYGMGPGDDLSTIQAAGGVGAALDVFEGGSFTLAPFASARFGWTRFAVGDFNDSDTSVLYGIGVAFRLNNGIILAPSIDGSTQEGSDSVLGLRVSLPLGSR